MYGYADHRTQQHTVHTLKLNFFFLLQKLNQFSYRPAHNRSMYQIIRYKFDQLLFDLFYL